MRDILFKGKIKNFEVYPKDRQWIQGDLIHEPYGIVIQYSFIHQEKQYRAKISVLPDTVCEYTEIPDMDGNRIFEGDVVTHADYGDEKFVVGKAAGSFFIGNSKRHFDLRSGEKLKVIGSIYDSRKLYEAVFGENNG